MIIEARSFLEEEALNDGSFKKKIIKSKDEVHA